MIKRIKERSRLIDPSSFLMIENCGDIYSQFLYANLTWNGQAYDEFFNIYKYTFPEFIQVNMINPSVLMTATFAMPGSTVTWREHSCWGRYSGWSWGIDSGPVTRNCLKAPGRHCACVSRLHPT